MGVSGPFRHLVGTEWSPSPEQNRRSRVLWEQNRWDTPTDGRTGAHMARTREAVGYLVVEDRRPRRWTQDGNAAISRVYASRPDRGTIPANAIIVPIRLVLSGAR